MRKIYLFMLTLLSAVGAWAQIITARGDQLTNLSTITTGTGHGDHYIVEVVKNKKSDASGLATPSYLYTENVQSRIKSGALTLNDGDNYKYIFNIFRTESDKFKIYVNDKGIKSFAASGASDAFDVAKTTPADEYAILAVDGQPGVFQLRGYAADRAYLQVRSGNEVGTIGTADNAMLVKIYKATVKSSEFTIDESKSYYLLESTSGMIVDNTKNKVKFSSTIGNIQPFKIAKTAEGLYTFKNEADNTYLCAGWWDAEMANNATNKWCIEKVDGNVFALHFMGSADANFQTGFLGAENKTNGQQLYSNQTVNAGKVLKFILKATDEKIGMTYSYKVAGVQKKTEQIDAFVGFPFPSPTQLPDYVNYTLPEGNVQASDAGKTKDIICTYSLPFEVSENYASAKWYMIDIHSNNGQYMWKYASGSNPNIVTPVTATKQTTVLGNEYMWCFIGNPFVGFEVYNKAAGSEMTLYRAADSGVAGLSSGNTGNNQKFELKRSSAISNAFCLRPLGHTKYLNHQDDQLKSYGDPDEGSSCRVIAPTLFVENMIDPYLNIPVGAVGSPTSLDESKIATLSAAKTAIDANPLNVSLVTDAVTNILNTFNSDAKIPMSAGYYFLKTGVNQNASGCYMTYEGTNCKAIALGASEKLSAKHVWKVESTDGGKYKMSSCNLGNYLKAVGATNGGTNVSVITANQDAATSFTFTDNGSAQIIIRDGGDANKTMRTEGDGSVDYWSGHENDRYWYVIPASELDINIGATGYATTYLPFDVVIPNTSDLKVYAVTETTGSEATLAAKNSIPAGQGALLKGAKNTDYKLTISNNVAPWDANKLKGTYTTQNIVPDANTTCYVLAANGTNEAGFYKVILNQDQGGSNAFQNNANKAYLPVSTAGARVLTFNFDDNAETGINAVEIEEAAPANDAIYDLSGRRVQNAKSGLYIINGKKVIK